MKLYIIFNNKEKKSKDVIFLGVFSFIMAYLFILIMGFLCFIYPILYDYTGIIGIVALGILLYLLFQTYQVYKNISSKQDINLK